MVRMSSALLGVVAVLLVGCGDPPAGTASGAPSGKASGAPASAKPSGAASTTAATTTAPAPSASASADAGEKKAFSCDAAATQNVCIDYVGKDHSDEAKVKALCDDAKLKGTLSSNKPCVKEGALGMCTTDAGGGAEANTYVYEKGAKTLKVDEAKKAHCAVGDWVALK